MLSSSSYLVESAEYTGKLHRDYSACPRDVLEPDAMDPIVFVDPRGGRQPILSSGAYGLMCYEQVQKDVDVPFHATGW